MERRIEVAKEIVTKYGYAYRCSFSENSPTEEKVCLRYDENRWHVYYVEKGACYDDMFWDDINDACVHFILRAILDKAQHRQAIEDYYNKLVDDKNSTIRKETIHFLVSSEALKVVVS